MRTWYIVPLPILLLTIALTIGIAAAAPPFPPDICPCVGGGGGDEVTAERDLALNDVAMVDEDADGQSGGSSFVPVLSVTLLEEDTLNPADNLPFN